MNKQNPFTNNRFHFLDDDNVANEKFKSFFYYKPRLVK